MLSYSFAFGFSTSAVNTAVTSCCGVIHWLPIVLLTTMVRGSFLGGRLCWQRKLWSGTLAGLGQAVNSLVIGWQRGRLWGTLAGLVQAVTGHAVHELRAGIESIWEVTKLRSLVTYKYVKSMRLRQGSAESSCVSVGSISLSVVLTCVLLRSARVVAGLGCCNMFPPPSICQPLLRAQHPSPNVMFSLHSPIWELYHFAWRSQVGRQGRELGVFGWLQLVHTCVHLFQACCPHSVLLVFWHSQMYVRDDIWNW